MRKSLAVLAAVGLVATMAVAFAGPAGAKGTPKPSKPAKESKCTKNSKKGITYSLTQFFTAPTAAGKVAYVVNGAALQQVVDQSNTAAQQLGLTKAGQNTIPVGVAVQCTGKTAANFTFDLQFQDATTGTTVAPLGLKVSGDAVIKKGGWLISAATVCDLTQMESAQFGTACYNAAGLPVPPAAS
jgi:hypothetical protein